MIDKRAIVDPNAVIAKDVTIGPWSIIGPNVEIGAQTVIGPHVIIQQDVRIGKRNNIHGFASIGGDPQHKAYAGETTLLELGDDNDIREFVTLNRGSKQGRGVTKIGDRNLMMAYVHVAHDCIVGSDCVFVNNATLGGHVEVGDFASLGAFTAVHQFCYVGAHSFLSRACVVVKDILPFIMVTGNPSRVKGLNKTGLARRGFSEAEIQSIEQAYRVIFREGLTVAKCIDELRSLATDSASVALLTSALQKSTRGIVR